ncbi:electron transport complex subunit RsxD [Motiliproteus sp. MSK22-1]|uniref:electron transport complex subunit RsxD n=1 Tax=Motiliproteus sp. MSK22-1 TaxID=1897630 RepID=UPI00097647C1|nr:electron transport complex subunit RsxD [Motiliproteus sp. MSK22-1]OMH33772.1 electron transport complex subunit RsxD [Motiliproteus sp. MSK22-1]
MALLRITSPHILKPGRTGNVMLQVILATLPGLAALCYYFGWGPLINVVWAAMLAVLFEVAVIRLRKRPVTFYLNDYSAILTAVLLGLALPPFAPWWVTFIGIFVAIVVAKHLYGGLGNNPFNPAMVGYALLLISFPVEMTRWAPPSLLTESGNLGLIETLKVIFEIVDLPDAYTMATPLDTFKHKGALTAEELWSQSPLLSQGLDAWYAISGAFALGGLYLLIRKIYTWHIPVSMLVSLILVSGFFYGSDPSNYAPPLFHLTTGAVVFGAFFIATDPVTAATSNKGKLFFGAIIGLLIYIIRTWGNYPDAVAFAVLLMNLSAPFLDYYTRPRTYGHKKSNRGIKG